MRGWLIGIMVACAIWLMCMGLTALTYASPETQALFAFGVPLAVLIFGGLYLFVTKDDL